MAVVFRARDERLDRVVALKILAPGLATDQRFRQRFIRESRAAAAVDDPHIVPVHEAGEARGVLFIAMRYVPGGSVADLLHRDGPMSPQRAAAILSPIASALDAAHAVGLVHRDVKPANMLIDIRPDRPDHVYLSDFGLTKGSATSIGLTGSGQVLGTPSYMAPEQIDGQAVDGRTDQYALACAAFEMMTGEVPFPRDQGLAVLWAHLAQPPPQLSSRRPDLGESIDQVFTTALAKSAEDRYRACRDFADAFRDSLGLAPYRQPIESSSSGAHVESPPSQVARADRHVTEGRASPEPTLDAPVAASDPKIAGDTLPRLVIGTLPDLPPSSQGVPGDAVESSDESESSQESDASVPDVPLGPGNLRRLRPVMISFGALLIVTIAGLVVGYSAVQNEYYVGNSNGKVAIFRGINDHVLGISLSSVYKLTNVPVSDVSEPVARELARADPGSLAMAQQFVRNISSQHNVCRNAETKLSRWLVNKPTKKVKTTIVVNGHRVTVFRFPPYPSRPTLPSFCPNPP